jgi:hypothetical protein
MTTIIGIMSYVILIHHDSDMWFNANSKNVHLYHGENKLMFNEMMIRSALC